MSKPKTYVMVATCDKVENGKLVWLGDLTYYVIVGEDFVTVQDCRFNTLREENYRLFRDNEEPQKQGLHVILTDAKYRYPDAMANVKLVGAL